MADIFVSYTSDDRDWAFWIGQELLKLGHAAHLHDWEISGGGDISAWMEERHKKADHILCVVSKTFLDKPYSSWERHAAQWAAQTGRPNFALPVRIEDCKLPTLLATVRHCDLFGVDENEARLRLATFLAPAGRPSAPVPFSGAVRAATSPRHASASFPHESSLIYRSSAAVLKPLNRKKIASHLVMLSNVDKELAEHKSAVVNIMNRLGLSPMMREVDAALSDRDLIDASLAKVDEASAYIGFISYRYGQIPTDPTRNPKRRSLTELEVRYAAARKIPVCMFVMHDDHLVPKRAMSEEAGAHGVEHKYQVFVALARKAQAYLEFRSVDDLIANAVGVLTTLREALERSTPTVRERESLFINYRRELDQSAAGRLYDRLERSFEPDQIFFDVDGLFPGEDYFEKLLQCVRRCDIFLAVVGKGWADLTDNEGKKRLDNVNDWVRIEIEAALKEGKRIIPVLVNGAQLPRPENLPDSLVPFTRRHAWQLRHERFASDVDALISAIHRIRGGEEE